MKLVAGLEQGPVGLEAELLAALFAQQLGIRTPAPMLVQIDQALADTIPDCSVRAHVRGSVGLNYGSEFLKGGWQTWPVDKPLPTVLEQQALELFAFDALIENPDRRRDKPNLLWHGGKLVAIDHEAAFSFIYDILGGSDPNNVSSLVYMKNHVFYNQLRRGNPQLDRLAGAIEAVTEAELEQMIALVPVEWHTTRSSMMHEQLQAIAANVAGFIDRVRRVLL